MYKNCGFAKKETMPADACQWFYECEGCHALLHPRSGHCCVFCSYGTVTCPPMQLSRKRSFVPQQLIFYRVALGCEAAPGLGCGVKAKPVLRALACSAGVKGAWLKRSGTVIAVLCNDHSDPTTQRARLRSVLDQRLPDSHEIIGHARKTALREFAVANGWYQCDAVDTLSEEEAGIIATRLVRRVTTSVRLPDAKDALLRSAITEACRRQLVERPL